jgi:hypothetical protein
LLDNGDGIGHRRAKAKRSSARTELFKQFSDNSPFKKWLSETIFAATNEQVGVA